MMGMLDGMFKQIGLDAKNTNAVIKNNTLEFEINENELKRMIFSKDPSLANIAEITIEDKKIKMKFKLL